MAVTTTKTNKPINPRGNDQSPKGYNRAALYSGKALDFDGVNDSINCGDFDGASFGNGTTDTPCSIVSYFYLDDADRARVLGKHTEWVFGTNNLNEFNFSILDGTGTSNQIRRAGISALPFVGKWVHMVATYDGSSSSSGINVYINGVLSNGLAEDVGSYVATQNTSANVYVGLWSVDSRYLNGKVSGTKIFNTALTAAQVSDLYNNPEKIVPTGVADSALKLWLPMQEGAGTTAYNGAPDALGSNVVTNGTFDTDLTGWSTNDFSNGSIVQSSGTALITSNGGSGYPSIWQQVTTIVGERYIVKANFSNNTTGIWFWKFDDNSPLGSTNRVQFIDNDATASIDGVFEFTATSTLSSISAFAEQGNAGSFNFDNVEVLQISNIGTISGATWTHGIGAPVAQTSVIDWNKHTLDGTNEVLIPQGLTAGRDLIGNLFENVRKQGALNLDGNSWAEVHDNASVDLTTGLTLETWVYWSGDKNDEGVLGKWFPSPNQSYLLYANSDQVKFFTITSSTTYTGMTTGWHHIVGTYDGASRKLYIDGAFEAGNAYSTPLAVSDKPVEIGRYYGGSSTNPYTDQIAQPRIYDRALTAEEIERNYSAGKNTYK
jgi:hypothetical protein